VPIIETEVNGKISHIPISDTTLRRLYSQASNKKKKTEEIADEIIKKIAKNGESLTEDSIKRHI